MKAKLHQAIQNSIEAVNQLQLPHNILFIEKAAEKISNCFRAGNKVILAGNGGSLCDAMHFAEELTGFFRGMRPALPAIALSEPGHITCTANDLGFEWIFARGVEAFGRPGDMFIGLTTSGNSANIIKAIEVAKQMKLQTMTFLGKDGGKLQGAADLELIIKGFGHSDRIQEVHMTAIHIIIELVEHHLFFNKPSTSP